MTYWHEHIYKEDWDMERSHLREDQEPPKRCEHCKMADAADNRVFWRWPEEATLCERCTQVLRGERKQA